eukprot:TRINITY_DN2868_c0_g1_i1.p1 TRINITY_DN2868_c0_g1~~TRINITY_DN2868_c0_g1_i1.p1  ORF type:complete len:1164 (+),score=463.84 TRINITY_DN2868_c0_g1_i1:59-3550(+)
MNMFGNLQRLSIVSTVCSQLDNHFGANEEHRTLADFLIDIFEECETVQQARQQVQDADDEFPADLVDNLYARVKKMLPATKAKPPPPKGPPAPAAAPPARDPRDDARPRDPVREDRDRRGDRREEGREHRDRDRDRPRDRDCDGRDPRDRDPRDRGDAFSNDPSREALYKQREQKCCDLEIYAVYRGTVTSTKDWGAFVQLEEAMPELWRVVGKKEGMCHISGMNCPTQDVRDFLKRGEAVYVKVMGKADRRITLDMKEVDQKTGEDLRPRKASDRDEIYRRIQAGQVVGEAPVDENISGLKFKEDRPAQVGRAANGKKKKSNQLTPMEQWELVQVRKAGGYSGADITHDPLFDEDTGVLEDDDGEVDRDVTVDVNEAQPSFLKTYAADRSKLMISPVKLTRGHDSSLVKAAENGRVYARERREIKNEQERDKQRTERTSDMDMAWEKEMGGGAADSAKFGQDRGEEQAEWKKKAMGGMPSFGKITTSSIQEQRESLPIFTMKDQIINACKDNQCLVVIGETGSGKTTQTTQYLVEAGFSKGGKRIGCTQPRRVAATSIAKRVAEEYGCKLGDEVGYAVRFDDTTSPKTIIKYMTDGMLLREALLDPDLKNYSIILLDEAHERTVSTDVLFGLLKQLLLRRSDFHLIVTSATLNAEKFSTYFGNCPILNIPGRTFPVEILWANEDEADYVDQCIITAMQIHIEEPPGDILLFLTGQEEIDNAGEMLHEYIKKLGPKVPELLILPAYGQLPSEMQSRIFEPAPPLGRKIVIATNIAEASITIDGIYYVIDPGLAKQKRFNPKLGMDSLDVAPISQASAKQRAGRAGRTGPGKCYRLYTEHEYLENMLPMTVPEIQRTDLASTVMTLKAMGIPDLHAFPFMDPPSLDTLVVAMSNLYALGALDDEGLLTKLGRRMAEFPLEPPLSKVLITAVDFGCANDVITIIAMITVQSIYYRPKDKQQQADQKKFKFHQPEGDHLTMLAIYEGWKANKFSAPWCFDNYLQARSLKRAEDVRKQLTGILEKHRLRITSAGRQVSRIQKAMTSGFFFHAAKRTSEGYKTLADEQEVYIHPSSALAGKNPEWVIYHELVQTSKEYMREVMAIEPHWLPEMAPNFFHVHDPRMQKKKPAEKLQPMLRRGEAPDEWRLSKALKAAARLKQGQNKKRS